MILYHESWCEFVYYSASITSCLLDTTWCSHYVFGFLSEVSFIFRGQTVVTRSADALVGAITAVAMMQLTLSVTEQRSRH